MSMISLRCTDNTIRLYRITVVSVGTRHVCPSVQGADNGTKKYGQLKTDVMVVGGGGEFPADKS